jgi:hypothetical protein
VAAELAASRVVLSYMELVRVGKYYDQVGDLKCSDDDVLHSDLLIFWNSSIVQNSKHYNT